MPGLQFSAVFDVIKLLQFFHADFVLLGDGGQRFTPGDDVASAVGWWMHGLARRRGAIWYWARTSFPDHRSGPRDLLFQLQNVLGKCVDLGIELIDFPFQRKHFARRRRRLRRLRECSDSWEKKNRAESERLHSEIFTSGGRTGKRATHSGYFKCPQGSAEREKRGFVKSSV